MTTPNSPDGDRAGAAEAGTLTGREGSAAPPNWLVLDPVDTDLAPSPPRFVPDLPAVVPSDDGTFLPHPLDWATAQMIEYCRVQYPYAVDIALIETRADESGACESRLKIGRAAWLRGELDRDVGPIRWTTFDIVLVGVGGVGVGVIIGVIAFAVASG